MKKFINDNKTSQNVNNLNFLKKPKNKKTKNVGLNNILKDTE